MIIDKYSIFIFDFDGVISDTEAIRKALLQGILSEYMPSGGTVDGIEGFPTTEYLLSAFPSLSEKQVKEIVQKRRTVFFEDLDRYCKPIPGAVETIRGIHGRGKRVAVATTNEYDNIMKMLKYLGVDKYCDFVFSKEEIYDAQRQRKNYEIVLSRMGAGRKECVVIEDSELGVSSAKMAGIYTIHYGGEQAALHTRPDLSVANYTELRKALGIGDDSADTAKDG